jgi:uncharacterized protein YegP (UPF0339 family)
MTHGFLGRHHRVAGTFEIVSTEEDAFYFRLTAEDGTLVAVSPRFKTLKGVVAGINAVRENAATGLVVNRSRRELAPG